MASRLTRQSGRGKAPRSKLRGVSDKTERNSAGAAHPPSPRLRRGHLALGPHSKLWGIRAEASEVQKKICVPVVETTHEKAAMAIEAGRRVADLVELRADYLKDPKLEMLPIREKDRLILTCRQKTEGGKYTGDERRRFGILKEAVELGVGYVDAELGSERPLLEDLMENKKQTRIILSYHNFRITPSQRELRKITDAMIRLGADVAKIVTFAGIREDNLSVLSLILYAREMGQEMVAFCMGEKGKISRICSPWLGSAWTYAALSKGKASAPGQLTVREVKAIWENFK